MSLEDRDWYREALAERLRRNRRVTRRGLWLAIAMVASILVVIVLVAPPTFASRCDQATWQIRPVTCWQYSWQALSARVAGNMTATRGYPVIVVTKPAP